jgi:sugar phosphate isomerase/epimerase
VPLVHVKDHVRTATGAPDCPVGDGEVGYDLVLPAVVEAGVEWLVLEQDEPGDDPLGAVRRSLEATRALLA